VKRDARALDGVDAADAGADSDADAFGIVLVRMQARVSKRLDRRGDAVVNERIHLLDVFRRDELRGSKSRTSPAIRVGNVLAS
jgi:hypothetical protein